MPPPGYRPDPAFRKSLAPLVRRSERLKAKGLGDFLSCDLRGRSCRVEAGYTERARFEGVAGVSIRGRYTTDLVVSESGGGGASWHANDGYFKCSQDERGVLYCDVRGKPGR